MKYQPTVYVDNEVVDALADGSLKLQCGQWIELAWSGGRRARWVGRTPTGGLWAEHWNGRHYPERFWAKCRNYRESFKSGEK